MPNPLSSYSPFPYLRTLWKQYSTLCLYGQTFHQKGIIRKNEKPPFVATCVHLENIRRSKVNQSERAKNLSLIRGTKTASQSPDRQQRGGYQRKGGGRGSKG